MKQQAIHRKKRVFVLTGGGTGGHIYPALAIARGLAERFPGSTIHYVGGKRGLENTIVPREGIPLTTVHCRGLERSVSWQNLAALGDTARGLAESLWFLRRIKADAVIGTGGFVAFPVVMAATLLGIPALIHEQNAFPGVTNRLLAPRVASVMLTFPEAEQRLKAKKTVVTGLPIRPAIVAAKRDEGRRFFGLPESAQVLLAVGGSRGAKRLNEAMVSLSRRWAGDERLHILHVTGEVNYQETLAQLEASGINMDKCGNIRVMPYLDRMDYGLAACDLCVGRAGAAFISEVTVRGLPSILIPYPYAAENHQEANARSLAAAGAARVIVDRELDGQRLHDTIQELMEQPAQLAAMAEAARGAGRPEALAMIVDEVSRVVMSRM
ncbi:undecaprenyldiphospho-muramoylpentapeptide beta-N-acetylglucosaminyltransferase [Heliobacterium gestii]|uniref:UDP-N-acetylglucosamine--N-acetylmuramyl-(pentapeptide) pyrophosphoryl-undecaprenol N-acetylglucosamine transferase n=1 Tax=Heliomicrobium gestii TaxID=2699 RepID=A0A845LB90_HELGE|nr:undecaprenyldiphospho-muramoylpentapeptide beta-N-acetylglucosaminyltransferase [Heliomicrobium gestii]MBM7867520.1 UDP-N-acetylglucosamine--N-acetylmuramyl-(pentapeptide) pyrophosphoryl-undecaprenol N-acetylglucosamine transferase [Heliomicrobium gestii]MZP43932.1 undecaprenyldiphospho-muramoylpentapeptide beta-N-acetylglucosaminyltransferase [Heliomicrobium gestii]